MESDIDLIVEFLPNQKKYDNFIGLAYFLEDVFKRKVELITRASLSKHIKPHVDNTIEYVSIAV
jgi:predicted nucleotidyltransferase